MLMNEVRLSKSCIGDLEKKAVMDVLDRGYLGMGDEVRRFEEDLTAFFGRPAVCVNTGTAGLHLALQCSEIGVGDEVLVQSLTYVASFQAISAAGATPVAIDISAASGCIDLADAARKISSRTKAIMPVHYAGGVGNLNEVYKFAEKHSLRVIEDAAHAFGSKYNGAKVGSFGDISCFSFDGIKNITSGEGGCVVTEDSAVLQRIRDARLLGVENDTAKRFSGQRSWEPEVSAQGWRYHMSDIMAAIGRVQLSNFDYAKNKRQLLAKAYDEKLRDLPLISTFDHDYELIVPHIFVVKLHQSIDRASLIEFFKQNGIQVGVHYRPNHSLKFFSETSDRSLPVTDELYPRLLTLPMHPELSVDDIENVVQALKAGLIDG